MGTGRVLWRQSRADRGRGRASERITGALASPTLLTKHIGYKSDQHASDRTCHIFATVLRIAGFPCWDAGMGREGGDGRREVLQLRFDKKAVLAMAGE
jgi:hypothetical protein